MVQQVRLIFLLNLKLLMAFRTTAFQPIDKQMLVNNDPTIDFAGM